MSLIDEALRRVQDPQAPKKAAPAAAPKPATPPKAEEPPPHPWPLTLASTPPARQPKPSAPKSLTPLVAVLVGVAVGGWLIGIVWLTAATRPGRSAASRTAATPPQEAPASAALPAPLALTGVVVGSGEPYAVIDGRIVGIGEPAGDGTVEQITPQHVTLRLPNGQERVLSVPR